MCSSLALISGRATINSLDVLIILMATYMYVILIITLFHVPADIVHSYILCQALDIRTLQAELYEGLDTIVSEELRCAFSSVLADTKLDALTSKIHKIIRKTFDATSTMDAADRMKKVAASSTTCIVDFFTGPDFEADTASAVTALTLIPSFRSQVASRGTALLLQLRTDYLSGAKGIAPASRYLHKTKPIYQFVRITLGVKMHGVENHSTFANGLGIDDVTMGQNISLIQEVRSFR